MGIILRSRQTLLAGKRAEDEEARFTQLSPGGRKGMLADHGRNSLHSPMALPQALRMSLALAALIILIGVPFAIVLTQVRNKLIEREPSSFAKKKIAEMDAELDAIDAEVEARRQKPPAKGDAEL